MGCSPQIHPQPDRKAHEGEILVLETSTGPKRFALPGEPNVAVRLEDGQRLTVIEASGLFADLTGKEATYLERQVPGSSFHEWLLVAGTRIPIMIEVLPFGFTVQVIPAAKLAQAEVEDLETFT